MARNFTIRFFFLQKEYEAAVTVFENGEPQTLSVQITDPRLHQLVPETADVLQIDVADNAVTAGTPLEKLKHEILQAFKEYESQSPPISLW